MKTISETLALEIYALLNVGIHDTPPRYCMQFVRARDAFAAECEKPAESREAVLSESLKTAMAEIEKLKVALAKFNAPRCPAGMIEYEYCAGTSTWGSEAGASAATRLVCHLEYTAALPATETDPAEPASVSLVAAYHGGVNVLDTLVGKGHEICIEEEALKEVMS